MFKFKNRIIKDMDIRYRCKGFTYIELAIAMAIIIFIILAFAQLFIRSSISIKGMQFQTLAYNLAGDKMEEIKNRSFADIHCDTDYPNVSGKIFTREVSVTTELATTLKRVDIEVIWTEGGENRSIEVSTLIADK